MKAISIISPGSVELVDIPKPEIGPEDILIKIHYIGLCGSDLNSYRGMSPIVCYPVIPGHEISGVIALVGKNVPDRYKTGDKVTVSPYFNCNKCFACRNGRPNCCEFNQTLGVQRDGALTEYISIHYGHAGILYANVGLQYNV